MKKKQKANDDVEKELTGRFERVKSILNIHGYTYSELPSISWLDSSYRVNYSEKSLTHSFQGGSAWEAQINHKCMSHPVMSGSNMNSVPFIALKVKDLLQKPQERVLIAYVCTTNPNSFGIRLSNCEDYPSNQFNRLQSDVEGNLRQILTGKHPRFQL